MSISILDFFVLYILKETTIIFLHITCKIFSLDFLLATILRKNQIKMKKVYTCFCTDVIHEGHLKIIHEARKYGEIVVGVLSDAAMIRFNRFPTVSFEERVQLVKDIPEVSKVVVQNDVMYDEVVAELHPDYVIHGDNWLNGAMKAIRNNVVELLSPYGGEVIDVPYSYSEDCNAGVSSKEVKTVAFYSSNCEGNRSAQWHYRIDSGKNDCRA